jgi:aerobic-type carbon monoxide dehydrogenase small subunit (CoxS/CutS family)/ABC-type lipoprotein export system ATPase subunit
VGVGEVVALMGRNGAGKSTTLKAAMGMVEQRSGTVQFMGQDISRWPPHAIARAGLGYVPEDRRIFTDLTVLENLEVGRQPRTARASSPGRPQRLFKLFPNLGEMPDRPGGRMSGGEQQMLTVARTLMGNPTWCCWTSPVKAWRRSSSSSMAQMIHRAQALRASASCCRSRTCTSPSWCPTAPTCWRRARSATGHDGRTGRRRRGAPGLPVDVSGRPPAMAPPVALQVNGQVHTLAVDGRVPLLQVLRNDLGLNGPKYGCGLGECGACTVLIDGVAARSCCIPLDGVAGAPSPRWRGWAARGHLHPVQQAFIDAQAAQCGYCLNGMLMATVALLQRHPRPTDAAGVRSASCRTTCAAAARTSRSCRGAAAR